ncbi:hypothetical protein MYX88_004807 [Salmonella enterica]|nr:hypothetical protein [Salmonella enterica]
MEEQKLRALVLKLESLQKMRTQESNRIQVARTNVIKNIKDHIVWLDNEIATLLKEIQLYINRNTEMKNMKKLLESIPGLGAKTAAVLLSFGIHPGHFINARQAAA